MKSVVIFTIGILGSMVRLKYVVKFTTIMGNLGSLCDKIGDFLGNFGKEIGEGRFFVGSEVVEDEIDVAEAGAHSRIMSTEAKAGKIFGVKMRNDRFEAVVTAAAAVKAEANGTKIEVEIVANNENVLRRNFIKMAEGLDGLAGFIVISLGFNEESATSFEPEGVHLGFLPIEIMNFGVKIKSQKTKIVASKIILSFGVAKSDD